MVPNPGIFQQRQGFFSGLVAAVAVLTVALFAAVPARAQSIDAAKAAGQVMEKADGLLAVCPGAPPAVSGAVQAINAKRLKQYREIAASTGASMAQIQARAGAKLRQSSPGGCK